MFKILKNSLLFLMSKQQIVFQQLTLLCGASTFPGQPHWLTGKPRSHAPASRPSGTQMHSANFWGFVVTHANSPPCH